MSPFANVSSIATVCPLSAACAGRGRALVTFHVFEVAPACEAPSCFANWETVSTRASATTADRVSIVSSQNSPTTSASFAAARPCAVVMFTFRAK